MKKILSLLALVLMSCMGAWATVVHPSTGKYFTMHCGATSGHTANCHLDIADGQINYESYTGSYLVFEQANETEGQWYIKDSRSNKYLVVANLAADTQVTLSAEASTYWTTADVTVGGVEGLRIMPNGNTGFFLNNNGGFRIKANSASGGCSVWVLDEVANIPAIESGWYLIKLGNGKSSYHNGKKDWYVSGRAPIKTGNYNWGMRLSKDVDPTCYVYITKGEGDNNYTFEFMKGQSGAVTMGFDCQSSSNNKKLTLIPTSAGETTQWKVWGNGVQKWMGWELYNVASIGSAGASNATNNFNYFTFEPLAETPDFNPALPFESAASLATINTTKWYNLKVKTDYLVYDAVNNKFGYSNTKPATDNLNALFAFVGNQANGFKIFNYNAGKAVGVNSIATDQVCTAVAEADAHTYIYHLYTKEGTDHIQFEDAAKQDAYLNHLGAGLGYWVNGAYGDTGNQFTIEEVADYTDIVGVEYTMHDQTSSVADYTVLKFQPNGSEFAEVVPAGCTFVSQTATGQVSPENRTSTVTYTSIELPFTPGVVYRLGVRPSGGNAVRYCGYRASDGKPLAEQNDDAEPCNEFALENLWVFERVAGSANQFKLKNLAANAYLANNGFNATGTAYTYASTKVSMGTIEATGFTLANGSNPLGNHAGGYGNENHQLGEWNNGSFSDAGSVFWVESIATEIPNLTNVGLSRSTFLGVKQHPVNEDAKSAAAAEPNEENVKALFNVEFADAVDANKYYRISNFETGRSGGKWLSSNAAAKVNGDINPDDRRKLCSNDANGGIGALFQFEESDGAYYLTHVNSGSSVCNLTGNNSAMDFPINKVSAGTFTFAQVSGKWWGIKTKNANEYLHQSNWGGINQVLLWNGAIATTTASHWTIEEVEQLPLTVKESKWASACYPIAVTLPEALTAYYAQSVNAEGIVLKEIESSVIPANTPVLITGEAGNYKLTIGGIATAIEGNLFTGTTIQREGFEGAAGFCYGLSDGQFLKITGNVVAANKAYYSSATELTTSANSALRLVVGEGEFTGIGTVDANVEAGTYYDLNGRLVAYPTTGIYVRNGKKVFIK